MSNLTELQRTFDSYAQKDALWTVLTDPSKAGGRWEVSEFLATGELEIDRVLDYVSGLGVQLNLSGVALDFGCGVGRLTQALGKRFARCIGVDISPSMIEKAESLNRAPHRCEFRLNQKPSLGLFEDRSFDFVYSNIALQHVPPKYAKRYINEFARLLKPGGVMVFQTADSMRGPLLLRLRARLRIRARIQGLVGIGPMVIHFLSEASVRRTCRSVRIVDVCFTNATLPNFNGNITFSKQEPASGAISKQYCIVKPYS